MNDTTAPTVPAGINAVFDLTHADRLAVDQLIAERLASEIVLVNQISRHIINGGGKRMRPLVHLLSARATGYRGNDHIKLAAIIEFIHTSTLLHDDVVDESSRRRGQVTAHRLWGNAASVLVGDFLYSRSFQLMVELERMSVMNILANTTNTIAEGEVLQLMQMGNPELSQADYFQVISDKTACLFAASARLGGVLSGCAESVCDDLADFGLLLGQAFQIVDDILDYRGNGSAIGKNAGDDLAEGKVTLPLILALSKATPSERERLHEIIASGDSALFNEACGILDRTGAAEMAMAQAKRLSDRARERLGCLPESAERSALEFLASYAVERAV